MRKNKHDKYINGTALSLLIALMICLPTGAVVGKINPESSTSSTGKPRVSLSPDTIIVDDDPGGGDYTSIQEAIDNADVGDYIIVKDGTYGDQLSVYISVTIAAASGETPTIYVSPYSPGIDVSAPDVLIEGFEIYGNASATGGPYPTIQASAGALGLTIHDNEFKVFTGETGQVAMLVTNDVYDVNFTDNKVEDYNIGVYLQDGSVVNIKGTKFSNVVHDTYHAAHIAKRKTYYGSIQDAIDEAKAGKTIGVSAGTYTENIIINKSIVLEGIQAGVKPSMDGRVGYESIVDGGITNAITIYNNTSDVTIDGFTFTISSKSSAAPGAGVFIAPDAKNILITNNIFENITDGAGADTMTDVTCGVAVAGFNATGGQSNIKITNNLIRNVEECGIAINDKTSNVLVEGNIVTEMIGSNHIDFDPSWPPFICAAVHLGGQVGPLINVTVTQNMLYTNVTGDGTATAAGFGVLLAGISELTNASNTWQGFESILVYDNIIYGNAVGVRGLAGNFTVIGNITDVLRVYYNNITGNSQFGINNTIVNTTFDAINNWWGDILGPYHPLDNPTGVGDNVSNNVTFWPWLEFDRYSIPPRVDYVVGYPQGLGGQVISDTTRIEITAFDNESGMKSLTYRTWNTTHRWAAWRNYTGRFTLSGDGKHMVQYNATDNAGTKATDINVHYVDTEVPFVEVLYPNGGEFINGLLTIRWFAADKIPDQHQTKWNNYWSLTEDYPGHVQSFLPTEDELRSVQLLLVGDDANVTVTVFSDIYPVPIPIGQSSRHLQRVGNEGYPVWIDFPFEREIELNTSRTYYIGVTQEILAGTGFYWYYFNSTGLTDPYEYGQCWLKKTDELELHPECDWGFKTMFWEEDLQITIEYSPTGSAPWSTIAENQYNDGSYTWDTRPYPDGEFYKIRVIADDYIINKGGDTSDGTFIIDNTGPSVSNIVITDTTIGSTDYTKDGDNLEITATITGNPITIEADLSGFGKGSAVPPTSYVGTTARWIVSSIVCTPRDGPITVLITARDPTGDLSGNEGTIIADNTPPVVDITRPAPGLYIMDSMRLLPFSYPFIIGQITIEVNAEDAGSGVQRVEFYIEEKKKANMTESPFKWLWDEASLGFFKIKAKAFDNVGLNATDIVRDVFIINLDIFGHQSPSSNAAPPRRILKT
jgi:hypothetical protein